MNDLSLEFIYEEITACSGLALLKNMVALIGFQEKLSNLSLPRQ
jgi:hypothetical protein